MINPRTLAAGALVAALTAVLALTIRKDGYFTDPAGLAWWYAACWALFAAAALAVRKAPLRHAVVLIVAGGVTVAATGLLAPPRTSTDSYRYAWDGRVQAAGISPYDHAPADPALAGLRDDWLFPTGTGCTGPDRAPVPGPVGEAHCTRINRPQVHTIYPPVAEGYFLLVHELSPDGARHKALQTGGALLSLATTAALLLVLRRRGDPRRAAYWAWCPIVPIEAVNNAHADVLGALLAVVGLAGVCWIRPDQRAGSGDERSFRARRATGEHRRLTTTRRGAVPGPASPARSERHPQGVRRRMAGGALLGAAIVTKLLPAVVLPGALSGVRRVRDAAAVLLPAAAVVAVSYLPYVLASDSSVLGFLGGYMEEEGYDDPSADNRFALLRLVLPDGWAPGAAVLVLLAVTVHVIWRGDPERPWSGALLVTGTAFLLLTPGYSWYALLLVALVALDGRWEWLAVAVAGAAKYVGVYMGVKPDGLGTTVYAVAAGAVLAGRVLRRQAR
ncbi:glycosyltransferase 87 family protein [Streptomyces sp. CA-135486]|uniref:glycosyltransferase 87 family protein n=1 Tax=Streptomyces sp. CA-135486 TaxID=3240049 RepID=UPI003D942AF7